MTDSHETRIEIASILSNRTHEGMVEFNLNAEKTQMDLRKAREVHTMLGAAIEAAVSDQLIYQFLTDKLGIEPERAVYGLREFRMMRQGSYSTVYPQ